MEYQQTRTKRHRPIDFASSGVTQDVLGQYLEGVGQLGLLTAEDEVRLAQTMEAGIEAGTLLNSGKVVSASERMRLQRAVDDGRRAREKFIEANLRLVVANARRYSGADVEMTELIQEGNLGLITAVERFDWRRGFKFSTYATWWIRQAMQRARASLGGSLRIPAAVFDILPTVRAAAERLQGATGAAPGAVDIAEATGIPTREVEKALSVTTTVALEEPIGEDGASLGDLIADPDAIDPATETERRVMAEHVRRGVDTLPPLQRQILELRFGFTEDAPTSIAQIARATHLSERQARIYLSEALESLRDRLADVEEMRVA